MSAKTTLFGVLILSLTGSITAQEQSIKKKDVPPAVLQAFQIAYPKATVKGFSKETENGATVYEIESVEGKTHRDLTYSADGTVVSMEEGIPFDKTPEAVRATVKKEYPKGKIARSEKVMTGGTTQYEFLVTTGKKTQEIVLNPDGTIVKKENKKQKEEKEEEEEEGDEDDL